MSPVELQMCPTAHVAQGTRRLVLAAVTDAGIEVDGWAPAPGGPIPSEWRGPIAQPSFRIIVSASADQTAEEVLISLGLRIGDALARIRSALSSLPLSITAASDSGMRWFAFRPSDSPDALKRGVAALPTVLSHQKNSLGWDDAVGKWVVI